MQFKLSSSLGGQTFYAYFLSKHESGLSLSIMSYISYSWTTHLLINLWCHQISDFYWYKNVFLTKFMIKKGFHQLLTIFTCKHKDEGGLGVVRGTSDV